MSSNDREKGTADPRIASALRILDQEIAALEGLRERIGESFLLAADTILATTGRVITTGMGKAGVIATKVSATLASTGTPSHYLHPAEAIHGDLGRIGAGDLLLAFSKSGETEELVRLIPLLKSTHVPVLAITETRTSTLASFADIVLELGQIDEAGPHGLAPTASTIAMLALGDALAMIVQEGRDFGPRDFARFHPGGSLGRSLMLIEEVMRTGDRLPTIGSGASVREAIMTMTNTLGKPGSIVIVDDEMKLLGFFTDGDLRRHLEEASSDLLSRKIDDVMTKTPKTITSKKLAAEALSALQEYRVDQLPVVAEDSDVVLGLIDIQDVIALKL